MELTIVIISLIIIYFINTFIINNNEFFCPTHITETNNKYILWKNNKTTKMFNTYNEYKNYHQFLQANFKTKCKSCDLLKPTSNKPISNNALDKNWVDTTINNKWYNIEYFNTKEEIDKDKLLITISKTKETYLLSQPKCLKNIKSKNKDFYQKFVSAYSNYLRIGFKKTLGYIPKKTTEDTMTICELKIYLNLLKNIPKCNKLINLYTPRCKSNTSKSNTNKSNTNKSNTNKSNTNKSNTDKLNTDINAWTKGWTYISPNNLKSQPHCFTPPQNTNSKVKPLLDKGIPIGAVAVAKIDKLTPKFKYFELNN